MTEIHAPVPVWPARAHPGSGLHAAAGSVTVCLLARSDTAALRAALWHCDHLRGQRLGRQGGVDASGSFWLWRASSWPGGGGLQADLPNACGELRFGEVERFSYFPWRDLVFRAEELARARSAHMLVVDGLLDGASAGPEPGSPSARVLRSRLRPIMEVAQRGLHVLAPLQVQLRPVEGRAHRKILQAWVDQCALSASMLVRPVGRTPSQLLRIDCVRAADRAVLRAHCSVTADGQVEPQSPLAPMPLSPWAVARLKYVAVACIAEQPGISLRQLRRQLGVRSETAVALVRLLEAEALVGRATRGRRGISRGLVLAGAPTHGG